MQDLENLPAPLRGVMAVARFVGYVLFLAAAVTVGMALGASVAVLLHLLVGWPPTWQTWL